MKKFEGRKLFEIKDGWKGWSIKRSWNSFQEESLTFEKNEKKSTSYHNMLLAELLTVDGKTQKDILFLRTTKDKIIFLDAESLTPSEEEIANIKRLEVKFKVSVDIDARKFATNVKSNLKPYELCDILSEEDEVYIPALCIKKNGEKVLNEIVHVSGNSVYFNADYKDTVQHISVDEIESIYVPFGWKELNIYTLSSVTKDKILETNFTESNFNILFGEILANNEMHRVARMLNQRSKEICREAEGQYVFIEDKKGNCNIETVDFMTSDSLILKSNTKNVIKYISFDSISEARIIPFKQFQGQANEKLLKETQMRSDFERKYRKELTDLNYLFEERRADEISEELVVNS
jgi:hypothetical protein